MRKLTLTAATLAALTLTAGQAGATDRCQEDEPCWAASTMGNRTGLEAGVWYEDGAATTTGPFTAHGVYVGPELENGPYAYDGPDEPSTASEPAQVSSARVSISDYDREATSQLVPEHAWEPMQVRAIAELLAHTDASPTFSELSALVSLWIYNEITLAELYLILA